MPTEPQLSLAALISIIGGAAAITTTIFHVAFYLGNFRSQLRSLQGTVDEHTDQLRELRDQ